MFYSVVRRMGHFGYNARYRAALHLCGFRRCVAPQHTAGPQIRELRRDTHVDEYVVTLVDFFQVIECAGDQIIRSSTAVEQVHGFEDSASLHAVDYCARDRSSRIYCPAMIIIEIQLIRRRPVHDRAGPQERWSGEFPDGNRTQERFRLRWYRYR